jgi:predicted Zn-dependent protease
MKIPHYARPVLFTALLLIGTPPALAQDAQLDQLGKMDQFLSVMQNYYELIERIHSVAASSDKSAILQLMKIEDIAKNRGDRAEAIVVLREAMNDAKSSTVRNAAAMMLADALKETGQASEAIEVLKSALAANTR